MSGSAVISGISDSLVRPVIIDRFWGVPLEFYYALIICVVMWYVLEYTPTGRRLLIVGRSRSVARLSGLPVQPHPVARLRRRRCPGRVRRSPVRRDAQRRRSLVRQQLLVARLRGRVPGATTIRPGRFNAWGCFIAVYFLGTGIIGLQILGLKSYVQPLVYGGSLVVAVGFSQVVRGRQALDTA